MTASKPEPNAARHLGLAANVLISAVVAPLPERWRRDLSRRLGLSIHHAGVLSGLLQLAAGLGLWALGYWLWFHALQAEMDETARRLAATSKYDYESYSMLGAVSLWTSPLLTLVYSLTSVTGVLTSLLTAGGTIRTIAAAATGENVADPTLQAIEWTRCALLERQQRAARRRAKGAPSPDRLEAGSLARHGFDVRITTADDLDWPEGASVFVAKEPYFVIASREVKDDEGRLRTRHDLRRLRPGEIVRGPRHYKPSTPPEIVVLPES